MNKSSSAKIRKAVIPAPVQRLPRLVDYVHAVEERVYGVNRWIYEK